MKLPPAFTPINTVAYIGFLALIIFLGWEAAENGRWFLLGALFLAVVWATLQMFQPGRRGFRNGSSQQ
jgi:4-hydroxybenzoate polyprenyltransferase